MAGSISDSRLLFTHVQNDAFCRVNIYVINQDTRIIRQSMHTQLDIYLLMKINASL